MATTKWTEGRLRTFITSTLRGGFRKFPPKYECLKNAFVGKKTNVKTNRLSSHYKCNDCKEDFPTSEVQVDHIYPVIDPLVGFVSWDKFIEYLFCPIENLQVLCSPCHDKKTKEENIQRKKTRDDSKKSNKK